MSANKTQAHETSSAGDPWDQQPGETDRWYARFQIYLGLGPMRTLTGAARTAGEQGQGKPYCTNQHWVYYSRQFRWRERALAWDVHQRELIALSERNKRVTLHNRRIDAIEDYLETVRAVLDNANMAEADENQARRWMPQMRQFLLGLLVAERQEFERGDYTSDDPDNQLVITADDLRAAQRAMEARAQDVIAPSAPLAEQGVTARRTLYVCVGCDNALRLDLAALRAVRAATGLDFKRILDTTKRKFEFTLRRERHFGRPVELLHFALHASDEGIQFVDGLADGDWLSERLAGVRVMLLACCAGDSVGDWLGVVPYVISLSEEISHEDAAVLTQHFWHNLGLKMEPEEALEEALGHCPPVVGEYVVRHW